MKPATQHKYSTGEIFSILWRTQRSVLVTVLSILSGTFLLVVLLTSNRATRMSRHSLPADQVEHSLDPAQEERVIRLASYFYCTCGVCPDVPLEECACGFAAEERNFIREQILADATDKTIIQLVNDRFGGLVRRTPSGESDSVINQ